MGWEKAGGMEGHEDGFAYENDMRTYSTKALVH